MQAAHVLRAWGKILSGRRPNLSIEITRECPLRCPGCYAYEDAHLGGLVTLRELADHKGDDLVARVLRVVEQYDPLHLSIVGGDPLVRCRELQILLPELSRRGIHVQVVTSAFRAIPAEWAAIPRLEVCVSIDGLQPEHDERRKPATYERILRNIAGQHITVHCTITAQMLQRSGYLAEFAAFWSQRSEVRRIRMSIFTPQRGANPPEALSAAQREQVVGELLQLRAQYPKLDMPAALVREFLHPPQSPEACIFAQTTEVLSADFATRIKPCQFGGDPDCARCGCVASMGLAAVGNHRLAGVIPLAALFAASRNAGKIVAGVRTRRSPLAPPARVAEERT